MIKQIQDGEDTVFKSNDRGYGSADVEVLRLGGASPRTSIAALAGSSAAPKAAPGATAQLGTGPTASAVGSTLACEVTLTTGSGTSAATANTPYIAFTLTIPSGVFASTPFCSCDVSNQIAATLEAGALTAATESAVLYYDRAASSATSLVFKLVSLGTPTLTASTAYKFQVFIKG